MNADNESRKSGGAKTEEGKAIVSKNAIKHGLLSKEVLLKSEDPKVLVELFKSITDELVPQGAMEGFLVDRLVADMWRMRRALAAERSNGETAKEKMRSDMFGSSSYGSKEGHEYAIDASPLTHYNSEKILRYVAAIERSFFRTLHELQRIQAARKGEMIPAPLAIDVNMDHSSQSDE